MTSLSSDDSIVCESKRSPQRAIHHRRVNLRSNPYEFVQRLENEHSRQIATLEQMIKQSQRLACSTIRHILELELQVQNLREDETLNALLLDSPLLCNSPGALRNYPLQKKKQQLVVTTDDKDDDIYDTGPAAPAVSMEKN
jgi:hypothetical protein